MQPQRHRDTENSVSVRDASNSIFQNLDIEIDEKSQFVTGNLQVADKLRDMHFIQCFDGFDFDDHFPADEEVEPRLADYLLLIHDTNCNLSCERDVSKQELVRERIFIKRIQQAGAQTAMNFDGCTDDCISYCIQLRIRFHLVIDVALGVHSLLCFLCASVS